MNGCFLMTRSWKEILEPEFSKRYMKDLAAFLSEEYAEGKIVYPKKEDIFQAFCHTEFADVCAVIIGQDPYHNEGQAHGLSFSVLPGVRKPPSLCNIFQEIQDDVGVFPGTTGCLLSWAKQGVLLLNTILTVRKNEPKSHHGKGWEIFTDVVVEKLSKREKPMVFLLWGKAAQEKCAKVDTSKHLCLQCAHPSPYSASRGFFGSKHFSKTNQFLQKNQIPPINWTL